MIMNHSRLDFKARQLSASAFADLAITYTTICGCIQMQTFG